MSDLRENLKNEFSDPDYRYAYAESFLNTKIATQIKTLREQRCKKQAELGALIGTKQSGFSRFEDVNHSVWKTDTLWKIARALDVRLNISFETFGSLIDDKEHFNKESLQRPDFENDPAFKKAGQGPNVDEAVAAFQSVVRGEEFELGTAADWENTLPATNAATTSWPEDTHKGSYRSTAPQMPPSPQAVTLTTEYD